MQRFPIDHKACNSIGVLTCLNSLFNAINGAIVCKENISKNYSSKWHWIDFHTETVTALTVIS